MSHGFYLTYAGAYPDLAELRRFWETATARAGLVDPEPWEDLGDVVEQVAGAGDLDLELTVFLEGGIPREISIEGHWSSWEAPAAYRSIILAAQAFADATHGRLEDFDAGAEVEP